MTGYTINGPRFMVTTAIARNDGNNNTDLSLQTGKDPVIKSYPNPTRGNMNIYLDGFEKGKVEIRILDQSGKAVMTRSHNVNSDKMVIPQNVINLTAGSYIIQAVQNGKMKTTMFIKE